MFTFLPIAPCTFFVNGKRFDVRVNEPFSVPLKEAKIIASPSFTYRKYVRLITPLPKDPEPKPLEVQTTSEPKPEPKPEPIIEEVKEELDIVSNDAESSESESSESKSSETVTSKKRIRRKYSQSEAAS